MAYLKDLKKLKVLGLQDSAVTDAGLANFQDNTVLEEVDFFRTRIGDEGLSYIKQCQNMRWMKLRDTMVSDEGMAHLAGMKGLTYLNLDECLFVSDEGIANLKGMQNLLELHLWSTSVRSAGLDVIAGLTSLKKLNLDKVEVTDDDLAKLKALKSLEWLNLSSTSISDAGLAHLQELPQLEDADHRILHRCLSGGGQSPANGESGPGDYLLKRLPPKGGDQSTAPTLIAVLTQIDPLPGTQGQLAVSHGQDERGAQQRRLDVRRHIVGPLQAVFVRKCLRHNRVNRGFQVIPNFGGGILVQRQGCRCVLQEQLQQADLRVSKLGDRSDDLAGDQVKAAGEAGQRNLGLGPHRMLVLSAIAASGELWEICRLLK